MSGKPRARTESYAEYVARLRKQEQALQAQEQIPLWIRRAGRPISYHGPAAFGVKTREKRQNLLLEPSQGRPVDSNRSGSGGAFFRETQVREFLSRGPASTIEFNSRLQLHST
jgi:hypothetical protein